MSTFVRILAMTLVIYSCSASIAAHAWAQGRENVSAAAKAHYKEGRVHYQLGEYNAAIKEFKEAYRLKPDATFLFNIAQCHRQLHEFPEALRLYRNYLRDAQDAPNRLEVEKLIREITPMIEEEKASKPDVASASESVHSATLGDMAASQPRAEAVPVAPGRGEGEVEVVARPSDATISVNKTTVGSQSPVRLTLPPGLYAMAIEHDGYRGVESGFSLLAGEHVSVTVDLRPVKTHGWRGIGTALVVIGVLGEGAGIGGHVMANRRMAGSPEFNRFSQMETVGQTVAISSVVLAIGCYVLDWLGNRKNVESGPPFVFEPVKVTP